MFKKIIGLIKKIYWSLKFTKISIDLNDYNNLINAQKEIKNHPRAEIDFNEAIKAGIITKEFSK